MSNYADIISFLSAFLPEELPPDEHLLVWKGAPQKQSAYFSDAEAAATFCAENPGGNIYFGCCTTPDLGPRRRASASEVRSALCLWADVDFSAPHHSKANLPPDAESCLRYVGSAYPPHLQPSLTIHSGGGIQVFWIFKEPFSLETDLDRATMASAVLGVQLMLANALSHDGYVMDRTHDLSRVMRIGGTDNANAGAVVRILDNSPRRFTVDDFEPYFMAPESRFTGCLTAPDAILKDNPEVQGIVPRSGRTTKDPLSMMIPVLCETSEAFAASWRHLNPNLKDDSLSSYDASLCVSMARQTDAGLPIFSAQDMADVIVDFRLRYGDQKAQKKALRLDYLQRTIASALRLVREDRKQEPVQQEPSPKEAPPEPEAPREAPPQPQTPPPLSAYGQVPELTKGQRARLKVYEDELGIRITRGVAYCDPPPIEVELWVEPYDTSRGQKSGVVKGLMSELSIKRGALNAFYNATFSYPGPLVRSGSGGMGGVEWTARFGELVAILPRMKKSEDTTDEGVLKMYLRKYLGARKATEEIFSAVTGSSPWTWRGETYVNITFLMDFSSSIARDFKSTKALAAALAAAGFRSRVCSYRKADGSSSTIKGYAMTDDILQQAQAEHCPGFMEV